jgi:PPK2 family polyphosphate:nucleotide phosphotransferase
MSALKRLDGSKKVKLADYDPDDTGGWKHNKAAERLEKISNDLRDMQELQYGAQETPVLIVLQGLDTAGKDGTIRHVMSYANPQSCRVASFKAPTPVELAHDFLWRVHAETPSKGEITIFNRSHYEDVLVVRVHNLVPKSVWERRYGEINHFEQLLADSGTKIIKFLLYIDKAEQAERLKAREHDPNKAWKLSAADWKERDYWDDYIEAFNAVLNQCSKPHAPWYVVPSNNKWYRNLAIAETLLEELSPLKSVWKKRLRDIGSEELKQLQTSRQKHP